MALRISRKNIIWLVLANLILWQNALLKVSSVFRYTDELLTLFFIYVLLTNSSRMKKDHIMLFGFLGAMIGIGIIGNLVSDIPRSGTAIMLDILYFSKLYICLIGAEIYFRKKYGFEGLSSFLAFEARIVAVTGAMLAVISQVINLGMTYKARYGIKSFQFVYSSPGILSQYGIIFLMILAFDLDRKSNQMWKYFCIVMLFVMWVTTGRARGIAAIMIWILLMLVSNKKAVKDKSVSLKIKIRKVLKPRYILIGAIGAAAVGLNQVLHYLGNDSNTARSLLMRGGFSVMRDYFPFGAGLATFGTEMAAKYYSPLYYTYGLNKHWALKPGGTELTDCFWPAVGAEFGFFGLISMAFIVCYFCKILIKMSGSSRFSLVAILTYIAYLLISSMATSAFTAYTTTGFVVLVVGLAYTGSKNSKTQSALHHQQ